MPMSLIAAILAAASATGGAYPPHPLQLQVSNAGGQLEMSLVGHSERAWSARYELEVTGGPSGASNHSVQRGRATIRPGTPVTVATLRLGNPEGAAWTARLHVTPSTGDAYQLEWRSAR
jgi:hypothetical protein